MGYPLDPILTLRDAKGAVLAENDDRDQQRDALLDYTPPADGQYEIALRDVHGHGGPRYAYRLVAEIVQGDFALSVPADSFMLAKDKLLSIAVKIDRRDGFSDAIEFSLEPWLSVVQRAKNEWVTDHSSARSRLSFPLPPRANSCYFRRPLGFPLEAVPAWPSCVAVWVISSGD